MTSDDRQRLLRKSTEAYYESLELKACTREVTLYALLLPWSKNGLISECGLNEWQEQQNLNAKYAQ